MLNSNLATDVFIYRPAEFKHMQRAGHYFMQDEILSKGRVLYERC